MKFPLDIFGWKSTLCQAPFAGRNGGHEQTWTISVCYHGYKLVIKTYQDIPKISKAIVNHYFDGWNPIHFWWSNGDGGSYCFAICWHSVLSHYARKGVIHLASVPLVMGFQKLRHLMEQFGEVGRVYLAPEAGGGLMSIAGRAWWAWTMFFDHPTWQWTISIYRDRLPTAIVAPDTLSSIGKDELVWSIYSTDHQQNVSAVGVYLANVPCFVPMVSAGEDQAPDTRRCIKNCFLDVPLALVSPCCCTLFDCDILRVME